jgi:glycine betaine/choline ABC-type transport system substrate-binding protein
MALWPLVGVALARQKVARAMTHARRMLHPLQQPLPTEMATALEAAIEIWDQEQSEAAETHLEQAAKMAVELGYL